MDKFVDRQALAIKLIEKRAAIDGILGLKGGEGGRHAPFAAGYRAAMDEVVQMITVEMPNGNRETMGLDEDRLRPDKKPAG